MIGESVKAVEAALAGAAGAVRRTGPGCWEFVPPGWPRARGRARLEGEWLCLHCAPGERIAAGWRLLEANGRLDGGVRFHAAPRGWAALRGELPLDAGEDVEQWVRQACDGFALASALARGNGARPAPAAPAARVLAPDELAALCAASGWPGAARAGGRVIVDLEAPGMFQQAVVEPRGAGIVAALSLGRAAASPCARRAQAAFLLAAGGALRLARPAAESGGGQPPEMRLEVAFPEPPPPSLFSHAAAALSVGCRCCAREVASLADDRAAALYLRVRGLAP